MGSPAIKGNTHFGWSKDFASFGGTEFDIISGVTLSKEDPESVAPNHKTPTRGQQDKYSAAQPPNKNHSCNGWSNQPSEVDREQCLLERSKPRKKLEYKCNVEKLEDDPELTRVFDKKLIKRWGSKPVDIVTEFTYMEVVDTGTPENVRLHFDYNFRLLHKYPAGLAVFPLLIY